MHRRAFLKTAAGRHRDVRACDSRHLPTRRGTSVAFCAAGRYSQISIPIWNTSSGAQRCALIWTCSMAWTTAAAAPPNGQAEDISTDGLTWTFRLRPGLKLP